MVKLEVVPGRKGPNDELVLVYAYGEPLSFHDLLFILQKYFRSEESHYPKPRFLGSCMLMEAIVEVYSGVELGKVLSKFGLERKTRRTVIIEKMPAAQSAMPSATIMKVHEVLE
jgi:hypothetical protein